MFKNFLSHVIHNLRLWITIFRCIPVVKLYIQVNQITIASLSRAVVYYMGIIGSKVLPFLPIISILLAILLKASLSDFSDLDAPSMIESNKQITADNIDSKVGLAEADSSVKKEKSTFSNKNLVLTGLFILLIIANISTK